MKFKELSVGDEFHFTKVISTADVIRFAELSGDSNPIHLDADFAADSIFKKPIIHGMIVGALFSKVIASDFPGPGSIYLHQSMDFKKPIYHDSTLQLHLQVVELKAEKKIVMLKTDCLVDDELVVAGSAVVKCLK